ncbi:MAG: hypothetical protein EA349_00600 [Halomonadaceae bacterium]|nr:MAG: hypothetical protein EA349_00600 [Halomonadaceae bacterium]
MKADSATAINPLQRHLTAKRWPARLLTLLLMTGLLTACLEDSKDSSSRNNPNTGPQTGQITLTGIEGLSYQTESKTGTTDAKGRYGYLPGQTVTFTLGNLPLAEAIPAREFLTPMEFTYEQRQILNVGGVEDSGMTSHRVIEKFLASNNPETINIMRMLMVLDQDQNASADNPVQITQRTIDQINTFLTDHPDFELNFADSPGVFARAPNREDRDEEWSDANRLIQSLCFHPVGHELCEEPPSQEAIDQLKPASSSQTPSDEYLALVAKKEAIESARREIRDVNEEAVRDFLLEQTDLYKLKLERPFTLRPDTLTLRPGDTGLKELAIVKIGGPLELANLEVESKNQDTVIVHGYSAQTGTANFHLTTTAAHNDEATLLVNFKLPGDYRWYRKSLLVRVNENAPGFQ